MSTRKIKDAQDVNTNELIYFRGHALATFMSDGSTVEDAINNINITGGNGNGNINLSNYYTKTEVDNELNTKQDIISDLSTIRSNASKGATAVQPGTLSAVATSGSYNDLTNKPTIPSAVTESTVSGWGFTKNTGTVTGIKMNGSSKSPSNGIIDLGTVITSHQDISGKQDKLVSGTNIKTINGTSILGSGDITISGGSDSLSGGNGAYAEVNHGTSDTTFALTPNTFHVWDEVANLTLTLGSETSGVANEYLFQFTSGSEPTTLILPDSIKFNSDFTIEENKIYQISILNGLGTVMSWEMEVQDGGAGGGTYD